MAEFAFVGPDSTTANRYQDNQILVNWYVEIDPNDSAKTPKSLLGCPGLFQVATIAVALQTQWSADSTIITADSTLYTADGA